MMAEESVESTDPIIADPKPDDPKNHPTKAKRIRWGLKPADVDEETWPLADEKIQVTSVVGLLVTDITLLKSAVEGGPSLSFYYFYLIILSIALILLVFAGAISMWNALLRSHYREGFDVDVDSQSICCPCKAKLKLDDTYHDKYLPLCPCACVGDDVIDLDTPKDSKQMIQDAKVRAWANQDHIRRIFYAIFIIHTFVMSLGLTE